MGQISPSFMVFVASLIVTFWLALRGRRTTRANGEGDLAGRSLNRWLVGLSAGATANSGFIVTGAVGLGYLYGIHWIMLPLAWLLGDLVFWKWFPERINAFGRQHHAVTLSEMLRVGLPEGWSKAISILTAIVIILGLGSYTAAQWIAGQKFLLGAFGLPAGAALALFALLIIAYSTIGGFRGSVYVDTFQAVVRMVGTLMVVVACILVAGGAGSEFSANIASAGPDFLKPFPGATFLSAAGFILGWSAAALGFGLGQPQVLTRYLAASSPQEVRAARWIYISYVQLTWITMTAVGVALRGIMPDLEDPEAGLSIFVQTHLFAIASGIIIADIFGVIASTANSLLIALAQSLKHDVIEQIRPGRASGTPLAALTLVVGLATMGIASVIEGNVASIAISAISFIGAGLAGPMMIKVMGWRHTGVSLTLAMLLGIISSVCWSQFGLSAVLNEAAIGIAVSIVTNWLLLAISDAKREKQKLSATETE
ncbi:MAG: hypothetical protein GXP38_15825 [Chloroflexi bacterium]|nr:hypothetical protein [Chloroflexota bacterium]